METTSSTRFPRLGGDRRADAVVVGGGITGLTAALLLRQAGVDVVLLDAGRVAAGETGYTTAHLTLVLDLRFERLISRFGEKNARLVVESKRAALARIAGWVREGPIDCAFERVPGFLFSESDATLRSELESAWRLGISAARVDADWPLSFPVKSAIRFEDQAQFHPRLYALGLARRLRGSLFEQTRVVEIEEGRVHAENGTVTAPVVVVAANVPICNRVFLHTKLAAYRSYVLAARVPRTQAPRGLFWDTDDPYHYIRSFGDLAIVGGEDHKTGEEPDPESRFARLERYARDHFKVRSIPYRWSGQIIHPVDGLPYIGRNSLSKNIYVATGFMGNGLTFGTLSGMIVSDLILGRSNPYQDLYDATRIKPLVSARKFVAENVGFPAHWVADRLGKAEGRSIEEIRKGEGKIVSVEGEKTAVYRDGQGRLFACSAVCPHLGCLVRWNNAEKTWDCPCHGSRFDPEGKVLNGPSTRDLKRRSLP